MAQGSCTHQKRMLTQFSNMSDILNLLFSPDQKSLIYLQKRLTLDTIQFSIMKKFLFILLSVIGCLSAQTNQVPNSSFDRYKYCPITEGQIDMATPWFRPTFGTSDLYHACATIGSGLNMPGPNCFGNALVNAHSGSGMAGLFHFVTVLEDSFGGPVREYLAVRLTNTLVNNTTYYASFYARLADSCIYGGNVSMLITKDSINQNIFGAINRTPQINNAPNSFVTNKKQWTKISGSFVSNGTEKFIYIGNFKSAVTNDTVFVGPGKRTKTFNAGGGKWNGAYFYVDDVCISTDPMLCVTPSGIHDFSIDHVVSVFPKPNNEWLKIVTTTSEHINSIELIDIHGNLLKVYDDLDSPEYIIDTSDLEKGMYFLVINLLRGIYHERIIKD